jgi:hypothetical protein
MHADPRVVKTKGADCSEKSSAPDPAPSGGAKGHLPDPPYRLADGFARFGLTTNVLAFMRIGWPGPKSLVRDEGQLFPQCRCPKTGLIVGAM